MNCPYCETEMEKGLLQSAKEILWSDKRKRLWFSANKADDILVAPMSLFGSVIESYLCRNCKKIVTTYKLEYNPE